LEKPLNIFLKDIREKYQKIEWKKAAGLRDIVVHGYFGIDDDIIWDVVENKIPGLKPQIEAIIKETKTGNPME
jgi:uncharacterized protein with HEPN domain